MQPCLITKTFIAEDNDWPLKRAFKDGGQGTYTATYPYPCNLDNTSLIDIADHMQFDSFKKFV